MIYLAEMREFWKHILRTAINSLACSKFETHHGRGQLSSGGMV